MQLTLLYECTLNTNKHNRHSKQINTPIITTTLHPVRNPRFVSFRTQPLENLSAAVKLPIKKGFWATQPLEQILVAEFLLCELGVTQT